MILSVRDSLPKAAGLAKKASAEFPLQDSAVYGPIHSRRLGNSLGINPLPLTYKFCDFDCVYCQYGWTPEKGNGEKIKRAAELLAEIRQAFQFHRQNNTPIHCITIAGNGEPTIHPDFPQLVDGLIGLRNEFYPGVMLGVLTDSSQAHKPEIRAALDKLDERYMKLDAGSPELLARINKPRGDFQFNRLIDTLKNMRPIVIQSLFMQGSFDNTHPEDIETWIKQIKVIHPDEVQVYTIDRKTADPGLRKVTPEHLNEIANLCQTRTGVPCEVYE